MQLIRPKVRLDPDKPFENDPLSLGPQARILTQLLESITEPFVLSIDAGWGRGKTTFVSRWAHMLQNEKFRCLYFNAWENDYSDDPLISFVGEISSGIDLSNVERSRRSRAKSKLNKVKKLSGHIAKRFIPVTAKLTTAGLLDFDQIAENEISKTIGDLVEESIEQSINEHEKQKNVVSEFKNSLQDFAELTSTTSSTGNKPLIFFIDELDRCKPTYAIELLERLKHFFNVQGIIFVLVMDKEQLRHSICSQYGIGMDADGYLKRFIDQQYKLPDPPIDRFIDYLFEKFGFSDFFSQRPSREEQFLKTTLHISSVAYSLGLRDIEQCLTRLSIIIRTIGPNEPLFPIPLSFLLVVRSADEALYKKYLTHYGRPDMPDAFKRDKDAQCFFSRTKLGHLLQGYLEGMNYSMNEIDEAMNTYSQSSQPNKPDSNEQEYRVKGRALEDIWNRLGGNETLGAYMARKLDISDQFIASS